MDADQATVERVSTGRAKIEKYERLRTLGRGAFGVAVLVQEKEKDGTINRQGPLRVVKEIDLGRLPPSARKETKTEISALAEFCHPHIVEYVDAFLDETTLTLNIVMEFADGGDLAAMITKRKEDELGGFAEDESLVVLAQCLDALAHVHKQRIIHRDIKGQNIFLTTTGNVKLGDFGIAKVLEHTAAACQTMIGTPHYLAPEVCESAPYGCKADIWSMGVVYFELLMLKHPFEASNIAALVLKIITADVPPLPSGPSGYTQESRDVAVAMLQKAHADRPEASELLNYPTVRRHVGAKFEPSIAIARAVSRGKSSGRSAGGCSSLATASTTACSAEDGACSTATRTRGGRTRSKGSFSSDDGIRLSTGGTGVKVGTLMPQESTLAPGADRPTSGSRRSSRTCNEGSSRLLSGHVGGSTADKFWNVYEDGVNHCAEAITAESPGEGEGHWEHPLGDSVDELLNTSTRSVSSTGSGFARSPQQVPHLETSSQHAESREHLRSAREQAAHNKLKVQGEARRTGGGFLHWDDPVGTGEISKERSPRPGDHYELAAHSEHRAAHRSPVQQQRQQQQQQQEHRAAHRSPVPSGSGPFAVGSGHASASSAKPQGLSQPSGKAAKSCEQWLSAREQAALNKLKVEGAARRTGNSFLNWGEPTGAADEPQMRTTAQGAVSLITGHLDVDSGPAGTRHTIEFGSEAPEPLFLEERSPLSNTFAAVAAETEGSPATSAKNQAAAMAQQSPANAQPSQKQSPPSGGSAERKRNPQAAVRRQQSPAVGPPADAKRSPQSARLQSPAPAKAGPGQRPTGSAATSAITDRVGPGGSLPRPGSLGPGSRAASAARGSSPAPAAGSAQRSPPPKAAGVEAAGPRAAATPPPRPTSGSSTVTSSRSAPTPASSKAASRVAPDTAEGWRGRAARAAAAAAGVPPTPPKAASRVPPTPPKGAATVARPLSGMRRCSSSPGSSRHGSCTPRSREGCRTPEQTWRPQPPPDLSELAVKFKWAAEAQSKFAEKDLSMSKPLWGAPDRTAGSQKKKTNLNELFDEISKLTNQEEATIGPSAAEDTASSFLDRGGTVRPKEAGLGDMTEDWGDAVKFSDSVQFGVSGSLASEDILAAALR